MTSKSIRVPGIGLVKYTKIGDLSAAELNDAITGISITYVDPATNQTVNKSHYGFYNENEAATQWMPEKGAKNGMDLYKVQHNITNKLRRDLVTGLLAVPTGLDRNIVPLLSLQHGTNMSAVEAPSMIMSNDVLQRSPSGSTVAGQIRITETLFNLGRFVGNGYALVAADYNGLGGSNTKQYYGIKIQRIRHPSG